MPSAWQKECNILSTIHSVDPVFFLSRTAGTDCILVGRSWYFMLVASRHSINHLLWCFEQVVMVLSQSCTITYILTSCDTYGKSKINKSHTSSKQAPIWGAVCRLKPLASTYNMPQGHVQILGNWYHLQNFTKQPLFFMFDLPFFAFFLIFGLIWTRMWFILCCLSIYLLSFIHLLEGWIVELGLLALFIPKGWFERQLNFPLKLADSQNKIISLGGKFPTCLADLVVNLCKSTVSCSWCFIPLSRLVHHGDFNRREKIGPWKTKN